MNVRQSEQPFPAIEACNPAMPGYIDPPPNAVGGDEGRLAPALRLAAQTKNATNMLTQAAVAQCQQLLSPLGSRLTMAFADLAVTGRVAYDDFCSKHPQLGSIAAPDPIQAAALAQLTALGIPGVTKQLVNKAVSDVLDRAYQVAWILRAQAPRSALGWIATSGEDDLPHRPVNVPRTNFPQGDLIFTVPSVAGAIAVRTRYAIETAMAPVTPPVAFPQRNCPPVVEPFLPPNDRIILFIHGSDSRLEEADDIIPHLVRTPDGRPTGITVISMDLPGSGYVNPIDHLEVGPWNGLNQLTTVLLPFMERFIVNFVSALSSRLGQPGLVEKRIVAVMGGSLGGNLALRLARRSEPWLRNAIAFSPGSIWNWKNNALLGAGIAAAVPFVSEVEGGNSRRDFFQGAFDKKIPVKTQPDQWYRDSWPCKNSHIQNARQDRREIYTSEYRRWHWRISLEELLWSWQPPEVQNFKSRLLLGAGAFDQIEPAKIYSNTQSVASHLGSINGDTFFFENTGHSIHSERPVALARKIATFLTRVGDHKADDYDGDGKSDFAVWRPTDGTWHVIDSSTKVARVQQWGQAGDIPVPGDYDGDGKTDFAVWRPAEGNWYVIDSSTGVARPPQQFGQPGDIPVPGDYDGDGKTDFAVWRPGDGKWYVIDSSTGNWRAPQLWGQSGDIPVPGDYDGDGKTDFAVWRPGDGKWYVIDSSTGMVLAPQQQWGQLNDVPVPADYDAAGYAVWRPQDGKWHVLDCSTKTQRERQWGKLGDIPVPGDFDGDGKTDFVVWRPDEGNWYVIDSATNASRTQQWGQFGDIPLPRRPAPFQMAATPTFNIPETFGHNIPVGISGPGTTIHYTTDGTVPNSNSPVYSSQFKVPSGSVVKAIAVVPGFAPSAIATALVLSHHLEPRPVGPIR